MLHWTTDLRFSLVTSRDILRPRNTNTCLNALHVFKYYWISSGMLWGRKFGKESGGLMYRFFACMLMGNCRLPWYTVKIITVRLYSINEHTELFWEAWDHAASFPLMDRSFPLFSVPSTCLRHCRERSLEVRRRKFIYIARFYSDEYLRYRRD
jgi:hypothetical protein